MNIAKIWRICVRAAQLSAIFTHCFGGALLISTTVIAVAQDTYTLKLIAQAPLPQSGPITDMDANALGIACVAAGASGLCVYDVADPTYPRLLSGGLTNLPAPPVAVTLDGNNSKVAYVVSETNSSFTLGSMSLADPTRPQWSGWSEPLPFRPEKMMIYDTRGLLFGEGRVMFIDTKGFPILSKEIPVQNATATVMQKPGNTDGAAFVGVPGALQFWDNRTSSTTPTAFVTITNRINDLCLDAYLYVAAGDPDLTNGSLLIYHQTAPFILFQKIELHDRPLRIAASGGTNVFVLNASGALQSFVANSTSQFTVGASIQLDPADLTNPDQVHLQVRGHRLYVSSPSSGVQIFETVSPSQIERVGQFDTQIIPQGVAVNGKFAYMAALGGGLFIYDISTATNPVLVAQAPTSGRAVGLTFSGSYVSTDYGGVESLTFDAPTELRNLGTFEVGRAVRNVATMGRYALVAAAFDGLRIVDTSDPLTPREVSFIPPPSPGDQTFAVAVCYAYAIIGTSAGVTVANLTDPTHPVILRNVSVSQQPTLPSYGVRWITADPASSIAYFGGHGSVDFHDPTRITATNSLDWTGCGALANNYLFTSGNGRLRVTDVSRAPVEVDVGSIAGSHANGLAVSGNTIYAADAIGGLMVYQGFPPPRVRIVYPYTDVPVRSGQALDITWVAENTTNTAWQLNYYNEGSPIKLEGTLSANNVGVGQNSQWTLHTQLPDAISTTAGRISVVSADGRIEGSTTIMLEGQMKSSISLAASTASIT
jgi:hypothetical protein